MDAVVRLRNETTTGRPPSVEIALNRHGWWTRIREESGLGPQDVAVDPAKYRGHRPGPKQDDSSAGCKPRRLAELAASNIAAPMIATIAITIKAPTGCPPICFRDSRKGKFAFGVMPGSTAAKNIARSIRRFPWE